MSTVLKVNPKVTRLINYIKDIEEGRLQIPAFQRDFVWGKKEKLELFGSLKMGFPIGSLLFWKPKETFKVREDIGPYRVPQNQEFDQFFYILDGFQRLSTLFGCLINPQKTNLKVNSQELAKNFLIYYDLENEEFTLSRSIPTDITFIPVNTLIDTYAFLDYVEKLRSELNNTPKASVLIDRARTLSSTILDYQLPSIEIIGGTIEDAVDIFSRINSKGAKISTDWMVSALTYNETRDFRLGTEIDHLITKLEVFNFHRIKRELVLQCIQSSFGKIYFDENISDLVKKPNFIEVAKITMQNILKAVRFMFENLLLIDIKLLPYNNQLIFITHFFNLISEPSDAQLEYLKQWFWITTYSSYFTIYSLSKQRLAFNQFNSFIIGLDTPTFNDKPNIPFTVTDFPKTINFGSVRAKALVLFLLNYANDFHPVAMDEVDELKIHYLLREHQVPEGVIPIISYVPEKDSKNIVRSKHPDLSYLFEDLFSKTLYNELLLTEEMEKAFYSDEFAKILEIRKKLMQHLESEFTQRLGLKYEYT